MLLLCLSLKEADLWRNSMILKMLHGSWRSGWSRNVSDPSSCCERLRQRVNSRSNCSQYSWSRLKALRVHIVFRADLNPQQSRSCTKLNQKREQKSCFFFQVKTFVTHTLPVRNVTPPHPICRYEKEIWGPVVAGDHERWGMMGFVLDTQHCKINPTCRRCSDSGVRRLLPDKY